MLTIIQIIAIIQGIFVGFALWQRKAAYKQSIFRLFMGCIISVILFSIGDDDYNLMVSDANWFLFQEPLMITFFFLFTRYYETDRELFAKRDMIFFIPYLLKVVIDMLSKVSSLRDNWIIEIGGELVEAFFIGMLLYSIYDILKQKKKKWLLTFIIPCTFIFMVDTGFDWFFHLDNSFLALDSYGVFLLAVFLFYFVSYQLITAPKEILPSIENKYKLSNLSKTEIESTKKALERLMREEQLFKNQKLNASEIANRLGITRQSLSEVLNVHMGLRLQDYLNQHRVEAFIKCLDQEVYQNYTLLGIANEVGFSSKSSFNATFKKIKGVTPSQYRKREK